MYTFASPFRSLALGITLAGVALSTAPAHAVSLSVQMACATDYYAYCSKHDPEGPGVRACMRANGLKLSRRCVDALIDAGEVTREEVMRKAAEMPKSAAR